MIWRALLFLLALAAPAAAQLGQATWPPIWPVTSTPPPATAKYTDNVVIYAGGYGEVMQ